MNLRRVVLSALCLITVGLFLVTDALGQDSLLISYQGRLFDDSGNPVNNTVSMTFTIYDGSGVWAVTKWTETDPSVEVADGLFSVMLGSHTALPDTVFSGDDRYLGISVGGDPEISPRTLLTMSAGAAYSRKMVGDVVTGAGSLVMQSNEGVDSAIVMSSDDLESKIKIGMGIPPDDIRPGLTMGADDHQNYLRLYWMLPDNQYEPGFEISSDVIEGIMMRMGVPPEDQKPSFEVSSDAAGERVKMKLTVPPDDIRPVFEVETDAVSERVKMILGIPPDPYGPAFEFSSSPSDGAGMDIYDEIGKVMGFDPTPFHQGYNLSFYDPSQLAETPLINLGTGYAGSSEARFRMYSSQAADPGRPEIEMVSGDAFNRFTFGLSIPPDDHKPGMEWSSDAATATMMIGGGPPLGMMGQQYITLTTDQSTARIGIGTDSPAEALDVRGTAEVEGFKMANGAISGHVLTSDTDGNGTWQLAGGSPKPSCAGTETGPTTGTGSYTVSFPVTFSGNPYFSVSAVILSSANAGKPCNITNVIFSGPSEPEVSSSTFDLQYHDGATWTDIGSGVQVQIAYTAIEQ